MVKKLKVLFLVQSLESGGAEKLIIDVSKEMAKRSDVEFLIASLSSKNDFVKTANNLPVKICNSYVRLSLSGKNNIDVEEFDKLISDFKPDVIHSNVYYCELVAHERLKDNVVYVSHFHKNDPLYRNFGMHTFLRKRNFTNFYEKLRIVRKFKQCNSKFITVSDDSKRYYIKNLPSVFSDKIYLLNNAIDYNRYYTGNKKTIDKQCINLINIGRMVPLKNQIFLIEVLSALKSKNYNVNLTIIGNWLKEGENVFRKAKSLNLEEFVNMPGVTENVDKYLKKSHIYLHSSHSESFGLVFLEAMAAGLPVVTLDGKGNRDVIEQGKNGFMLYERDINKFVDKIIELIENEDLYQNISQYAVEYAKKYDIKEYVDKLLEIYSE